VLAVSPTGPGASAPLWSTDVGAEVTGGPILALGLLVVGTDDGRVVAFRPGG
jgi:hypothetical protein